MSTDAAESGSSTLAFAMRRMRGGMVGMGMIFDETYRPFFEQVYGRGHLRRPLRDRGSPAGGGGQPHRLAGGGVSPLRRQGARRFRASQEPDSIGQLLKCGVDFVCVATPDDRHFAAAKTALQAGKHVLIEKPSVLTLQELDELERLASEKHVLCKVVYHKLLDPDHKKLRTLVADGDLEHVNNGYCSLLEPKSISGSQFAEWIRGRNPGTYVAVHYIKLIDFTFGGRLKSISCTGQRGIVGAAQGNTWDSTQLRLIYDYGDAREAAFDIHTSWVTPDNFPGYVEQEVQFRFDNGVWNAHSRKRGVECTIEGQTPLKRKITMNNHYNGTFLEPWGERSQRGYGIEVLDRFVREAAFVEYAGPETGRTRRLNQMRALTYNDITADRQTVAAVQAMEAILARHAAGQPDCVVYADHHAGGLVLFAPGCANRKCCTPVEYHGQNVDRLIRSEI